MKNIMIQEHEWDQMADANTVEGPIKRVIREEIMEALTHMKIGLAPGPSEAYAKIILAR